MYKMTAQDIHSIDDKTSKHYQASQITKGKVDINKETGGYYKTFFKLLLLF